MLDHDSNDTPAAPSPTSGTAFLVDQVAAENAALMDELRSKYGQTAPAPTRPAAAAAPATDRMVIDLTVTPSVPRMSSEVLDLNALFAREDEILHNLGVDR